MKTILSVAVLFLSFSVNHLHAQKKLTIFCYIVDSKKAPVDYRLLDKILPDSLQKTIMVNPYKEYGFTDKTMIMQWLLFNDWKFITAVTSVYGSNGSAGSTLSYIFSKEISMDDSTYENCKEKLMSLSKRK